MSSQSEQARGGWLSFTALFSDGDRLRERASPAASPAPVVALPGGLEEQDNDAVEITSVGGADEPGNLGGYEELSDIRLDISDIQEAIKNHDMWVQDAVSMRKDIDELQASIREHEAWMANLSGVVRQIQVRDETLRQEVAGLRQKASLQGDADAAGHFMPFQIERPSVMPTTVADRPFSVNGDTSSVSKELQNVVVRLTRQLNGELRMLRTLVSSVEGTFAKQIESERSARRNAVLELRREFSTSRQPGSFDACNPVGHAPGGVFGNPAGEPHAGSEAGLSRSETDVALSALRSVVDALEKRTSDRSAETERAVLELRAELAALRTEQQLQMVAVSAGALTSSEHSQKARNRFLSALGERSVVDRGRSPQGTASATSNHGSGDAPTWSSSHSQRDGASPPRLRDARALSVGRLLPLQRQPVPPGGAHVPGRPGTVAASSRASEAGAEGHPGQDSRLWALG